MRAGKGKKKVTGARGSYPVKPRGGKNRVDAIAVPRKRRRIRV